MKYEKIENKYVRKSTRKNSKWVLVFTTASDFTMSKEVDENSLEDIKRAFNNVPPNYEKYIEEYTSFRGEKGIKYIVIDDTKLVKREIILISLED